ncbi:MAG: c-type cytochrome [Verrucomicrobiota bacterium]
MLGRRNNSERLERLGSAWTAKHDPDFLKSTSEWFRAVDLRQGPLGEVMVAEWTDLGECHDRDGIHRSSGRLYEIQYGGRPDRKPFDVASESTQTLLSLMFHENVWWRRQARRNLHERAARGGSITPGQIAELVGKAKSSPNRDAVSAIQALHAFDLLTENRVPEIFDATSCEAVRIHLLTLTLTEETPTPNQIRWLEGLIQKEKSPAVLYRIASLLQRIPLEARWPLAERLATVPIPDDDRNFILMRWYAFEPLVAADPVRAMKIALDSGHPWLTQSITRRALAANALDIAIEALCEQEIEAEPLQSALSGLLQALPARAEMPENWVKLYPILRARSEPDIQRQAFELAQRFGDPIAEAEMVNLVLNTETPPEVRLEYFRMLLAARSPKIAVYLRKLIAVPELEIEVIRAEAVFPGKDSASRLLALLQKSRPDRDTAVFETLTSRQDFADVFVEAILGGEIPKERIPAYIARQVTMVSTKKNEFAKFLGIDTEDAAQRGKLIAAWKRKLADDYLADANLTEGREVYRRSCAACHQLYGEGGVIGPDLTGSGRADLDYVLINVLFPSEDVSAEYRLVTLVLKDGRTLTGNIVEENPQVITFRQVGQIERIDASQVIQRQVSEASLMPPGLLDSLKREDVRDLVAYLQTKKPLP